MLQQECSALLCDRQVCMYTDFCVLNLQSYVELIYCSGIAVIFYFFLITTFLFFLRFQLDSRLHCLARKTIDRTVPSE